MERFSLRLWKLFLLGLLLTPLLHCSGPSFAAAQPDEEDEDEITDDEEDMEVSDEEEEEGEEAGEEEEETVTFADTGEGELVEDEDEEEEEEEIGSSSDAQTVIIFTNRPSNEFVAGEVVNSLIGFANNGEQEFIVTAIEASFRYPQDFNYFIQNFSRFLPDTYVLPSTEASFVYSFRPSESFYARPFGLVVNVYYRDGDENEFRDAVFNGTVNIVEVEEGFDAETFFMYVFMVSGLSLLMFIIHYVYTTVRRGGRSTTNSRNPVETGTQGDDDIDYQWLPPEALAPKKSPRPSPRNRKSKK